MTEIARKAFEIVTNPFWPDRYERGDGEAHEEDNDIDS